MLINEQKVKVMLSKEILNYISDGSARSVLRNILFSSDNNINWDEVYDLMLAFMPELNTYDEYKPENMI